MTKTSTMVAKEPGELEKILQSITKVRGYEVKEYINLLEECDKRTPFDKLGIDSYRHGYNVSDIKDRTERDKIIGMLSDLVLEELVEGETYAVQVESKVKVFRAKHDLINPMATFNTSSNERFPSYVITEKGKEFLWKHRKHYDPSYGFGSD